MKIRNTKYEIRNYLLLIIITGLLLPLVSLATHGDRLVPCGPGTPKESCQLCDIFVLFKNIIDFLLIHIVPVLAVLMIVIAGLMFIFAYFGGGEVLPGGQKGGPAMLSQAKKTLTYTIIGLVIIYASWLIVNLFFQVIGINEFNEFRTLPQNWWRIDCPF